MARLSRPRYWLHSDRFTTGTKWARRGAVMMLKIKALSQSQIIAKQANSKAK